MSLEEIIKRMTIELPTPLTILQAKELLKYIAKELPANIPYKESQFGTLTPTDTEVLEDEGTADISGSIIKHGNIAASDSFQFEHSQEDTSKLSKIRFSTVPGWELMDYGSKTIELWDEVKQIVTQYFQTKQTL